MSFGGHMKIFTLAMVLLLPMSAYAHGGGLDANGCHTKRATGEYHCHRGSSHPAPSPNKQKNVTAPT
jgi:hypothetical protein